METILRLWYMRFGVAGEGWVYFGPFVLFVLFIFILGALYGATSQKCEMLDRMKEAARLRREVESHDHANG